MPSSSMRLTSAGFREARRRFGEMLRGFDRFFGEHLVFGHRRQAARLFVLRRLVLPFLIEREEAVEFHHLAGSAQVDGAAAGFGGDVDGGAFEFGGFHLARDRAIPDQLVQPRLVAVDVFGDFRRRAAGAGRAYRFVRFLRVLRLVVIFARAAPARSPCRNSCRAWRGYRRPLPARGRCRRCAYK